MKLNTIVLKATFSIALVSFPADGADTQQKPGVHAAAIRDWSFSPSSIQQMAGTFLRFVKNRSMATQFTVGIGMKGGAAVVNSQGPDLGGATVSVASPDWTSFEVHG